jgi:hypothetical protein
MDAYVPSQVLALALRHSRGRAKAEKPEGSKRKHASSSLVPLQCCTSSAREAARLNIGFKMLYPEGGDR